MPSEHTFTPITPQARPKKALAHLRKDAGYKSAKEFADRLGMPASTYARYENQPETPETGIPIKAAWLIADALDCTIDRVVGREDIDSINRSRLASFYESLADGDRDLLDQFIAFIEYRQAAAEGR